MPIITKPSTIEKDVPATFTLDKTALAALPVVAANAWYGDMTHWKRVILNYVSVQYGESLFVTFDATQASPTGTWLAPAICQDVFEIVSISITDFANGTFRVPTSSLNQAEFAIDMASGITYIDYNTLYAGISTNAFGAVTVDSGTSPNLAKATGVSYIGQDFSFTFNIEPTLPDGFVCVISDTITNAFGSLYVGFINLGTPNALRVYFLGSVIGSDITLLPSGNTLKIERVSGDLTLYVNDVSVYNIIGFNPSIETFPCVKAITGTPVTSSSVVFNPFYYITYNNLANGGATDVNGKLYKGVAGSEPLGASNVPVGTFNGSYSLTFLMTNVNAYGVWAGISNTSTSGPVIYVKLTGGFLYLRDSNGIETLLTTSYNTVGDITVKMIFSSQTIQILLDDVEILAPTALYAGFSPNQVMYPSAIVSPYAPFGINIDTGNDYIKESSRNA